MYVYKWSQDLMYKSNVSKRKEKKKYILSSLHFTVAASMAHMKVKWSDKGKGTEKWCKILVIAEGKMSLSLDAESR